MSETTTHHNNDKNGNHDFNYSQFLSDSSHRVLILLRPAFLKSNSPVSIERPSKADCLRLKINYGALIKKTEPIIGLFYGIIKGTNQPLVWLP